MIILLSEELIPNYPLHTSTIVIKGENLSKQWIHVGPIYIYIYIGYQLKVFAGRCSIDIY